jgi:hypothetical protein
MSSVNVENVRLHLAPHDASRHALVISDRDNGEVARVIGTVPELRQAAQSGLMMSIPPLPRPTAPAASPAPQAGGDVQEQILAALHTLIEKVSELA